MIEMSHVFCWENEIACIHTLQNSVYMEIIDGSRLRVTGLMSHTLQNSVYMEIILQD